MNVDILINNLLSPVILSFVLGVVARLTRSDLAFPEALSKTLAIFLLLAIGMKGALPTLQWVSSYYNNTITS